MVSRRRASAASVLAFPRLPWQSWRSADRGLKQVLINPLFNAIGYNQPSGHVGMRRTHPGTLHQRVRHRRERPSPEQVS
jgi:hypothetical protein